MEKRPDPSLFPEWAEFTPDSPTAVRVSPRSGFILDADTVDGYHLDQDVRSTASPSFAGLTVDSIATKGAGIIESGTEANTGDYVVFGHKPTTKFRLSEFRLLDLGSAFVTQALPTLNVGERVALYAYGRASSAGTQALRAPATGTYIFIQAIYSAGSAMAVASISGDVTPNLRGGIGVTSAYTANIAAAAASNYMWSLIEYIRIS